MKLRSIVVVAALAMAVIACGMNDATPTAPIAAEPEQDNVAELATQIVTSVAVDDWSHVQSVSTSEFSSLPTDVFRSAGRSFTGLTLFGSGLQPMPESSEWQIETGADFTVARPVDLPSAALLFRQGEDGGWKYDPGPHVLAWAELFRDGREDEDREVIAGRFEGELPRPGDPGSVISFNRDFSSDNDYVESVRVTPDGLEVTIRTGVLTEARMPVDGIAWTAGGQDGMATVTWTNARVTPDSIEFPAPANRYWITALIEGAPAGGEVEIELRDLEVDGWPAFTRAYTVPLEPYPYP